MGERMATRKARLAFTIRRFRNTMGHVGKSKRGALGIAIITFFVIVGIFAPLVAPYDPISPRKDPEQYPAFSGQTILQIADKLCYPSWYKYVPWIPKGSVEKSQEFMNILTTYEGAVFSNVTALPLKDRIAKPLKVTAEFPNGSSVDLVSEKEWTWDVTELKQIKIPFKVARNLPNGTQLTVTYLTGSDITENIEFLDDPGFSSSETLTRAIDTSSNSNSFTIEFNDEKGYKNDGCIEIAYLGNVPASEKAEATLQIPVEYKYWEPPKSFITHFSARLEAGESVKAIVTLWLRNEYLNKSFLLSTNSLTPSTTYLHYRSVSTSNETTQNVGSLYPEQVIFPTPSNVSFLLKVEFPTKTKQATLYVDNLQCILYGNSFGLLGTDNGSPYPPRDIFSTLVHGTRVSLIVGILSALFSTVIGLFLGLISGYIGGFVDESIMRFADLLLVLPTLPLFIVLIAVMKSTYGLVSMWNIIILLTFFGWMSFSRSVRSMVLSIRERPFIEAARAAGGEKFYIITKHIIPNVFPLVYVTLATSVPGAIITEASLSWLGLGDPSIPSWGKVLYDFNVSGIAVTKGLTEYWFWIFPPCIAIALLATAFILLGFALDEILNPRLRERR
jgi:ABC-type dipeptide/oligopeptide/nickel transport system permease subunit